jgi:N-acetylmuramoyl-L-alanine amidase
MKASMVKNFHTVQSADFAQFVQNQLLKELRRDFSGVTDLGVKSARFFVLTGAKMPAILVETSFISNPQEERRLKDGRYQKSMAEAVVKGIDQFFKSSIGRGDHAALFK